jgi:hypothetical protein
MNYHIKSLGLLSLVVCYALLGASCFPMTSNTTANLPQNIRIQEARVDPAFASTEMRVIAFFPFSNAIQYDSADIYVLYNNLIDKFRTKHPQYSFIPPEDVMTKISSSGLSDAFNIFLGDYTNTGVANPDFLIKIKRALNLDAILFGKIEAFGPHRYQERHYSRISGKVWYDTVSVNQLCIRLACFRGKDGRNIWEGKHLLRADADLATLAKSIAEIFANYFGSRSS